MMTAEAMQVAFFRQEREMEKTQRVIDLAKQQLATAIGVDLDSIKIIISDQPTEAIRKAMGGRNDVVRITTVAVSAKHNPTPEEAADEERRLDLHVERTWGKNTTTDRSEARSIRLEQEELDDRR